MSISYFNILSILLLSQGVSQKEKAEGERCAHR